MIFERRFQLELPFNWVADYKIFSSEKEVVYKTYLAGPSITFVSHVIDFYGTSRYCISTSDEENPSEIRKFYDVSIDRQRFYQKVAMNMRGKKTIEFSRYCIDFGKIDYELIIYNGRLNGLAVLVLEDVNDDFFIPSFFKVKREITKDLAYNDYNLADLDEFLIVRD